MLMTNGWELTRDARGFWLVAGTVRSGPYTTPIHARAWAKLNPAPKKPVVKIRRKVADGEST